MASIAFIAYLAFEGTPPIRDLASWLNQIANTPKGRSYDGVPGGIVTKVWHSSLQGRDASGFEPGKQMEGGWNATFSILVGISTNVFNISDVGISFMTRS